MMRVLGGIAVLGLMAATVVRADGGLPDWVERSSKVAAMNQFIEWMQADKFYRIAKMDAQTITLESGQAAIEVHIDFDDVSGCKNRRHLAQCTPLDETTLFCFQALTDCAGRTLRETSIRLSR